jgi:hypothetical protein
MTIVAAVPTSAGCLLPSGSAVINNCSQGAGCLLTSGTVFVIPPTTTTTTSTSTSTTTTTTTLPPTTTTTTTLPPTTTTTTTVAFYSFLLNSTPGLGTGPLACADYASFNRATYYASFTNGPAIVNGTFLYTDSGLTTPIPNGYYSDGTTYWFFQDGSTGDSGTPCNPTTTTTTTTLVPVTTTTTTTLEPTTTTTTTQAPTTTTTTTTLAPTTTTTTTLEPTTTTTTTATPTTTTTTTSALSYKYYFQLIDLTNPPNLGGGSMTLNSLGGSATFTTDYNLILGANSYTPAGSSITADVGKRIQKIDKVGYDGSTVLYTVNVSGPSYIFASGFFDMTSTGVGSGQFQTIKVYIEAIPATTTTTTTLAPTTTTTTTVAPTTTTTTSTTTAPSFYYNNAYRNTCGGVNPCDDDGVEVVLRSTTPLSNGSWYSDGTKSYQPYGSTSGPSYGVDIDPYIYTEASSCETACNNV